MNYDDKIELRFSSLTCKLDKEPIISTDPVEESSYLGIKNYVSEDGFYRKVESVYGEFIEYLDTFIKENMNSESSRDIELTFNRLLAKYTNSYKLINESDQRKEWEHKYKYFKIPNPNNNFLIEKEIKYTRQAYKFFYKMSNVQLQFLNRINDYLNQQQSVDYNSKKEVEENSNILLNKVQIYYFKIRSEHSTYSHIILSRLHKRLIENNYIDCKLPSFKALFKNEGEKSPKKAPEAIIWKNDNYNSLAFFFKRLTEEGFLHKKNSPSNYKIALNLFYKQEKGRFFNPKKVRYDFNLSPKKQKVINSIVEESMKSI